MNEWPGTPGEAEPTAGDGASWTPSVDPFAGWSMAAFEPAPVAAPAALGWRMPPEMEPAWKSRRWPRRHWRPLLALGLILATVAGLALAVGPVLRVDTDLLTQTGDEITSVNVVTINGRTTVEIYASRAVSAAQGTDLACTLVRPILERDGYGGAVFLILDRAGDILADQSTSCSDPAPSLPPNPVT